MLVAVAETGSFSAAGRRLGRVQSAVSQSIQALERQLQITLFDRRSKTPSLTEAGRMIVAKAMEIVGHTDDLQARAIAMAAGTEPQLTIALDCVFPSGPIAASLRALDSVFPGLPVTLYTEMIGSAETRLREGAVQIALYAYTFGSMHGLVGQPLVEIPLIPVAAVGHPLTLLGRPLEKRDLEAHVQLILTDGNLKSDAPTKGVLSAKVWRFADLARRQDFLLEGFGWGSMPVHLAEPHLASGRIAALDIADPVQTLRAIPIYAVHVAGRPPGPAGRWLLDDLAHQLAVGLR